MSSQAASSASPPPPSSPPSKESLGRRYKFIWPLLIAVNFSIGAYLYTRTNKEEKTEVDEPATAVSSTLPSTGISTASAGHTSTSTPAIRDPVKPIPVDQQRELLKWILEEKRKVKTKDPQEKKQNNEEKALLKQLIRAKSIPYL
ncbi:hypothetical protein L1987_67127 [Smallanthus sonchifolius]|uniref:Uncharacterized protein n=1 Tax=Smallanthus sonchifolius TaxID=185202 RepID=A0ACB9BZD8_9ASTR|nr:hypothetical protein L1987_67127 [Smallanthus sonchifolius]